jgi:hypothetical protein
MRVSDTEAGIVSAWSAAAHAAWKDEVYVDDRRASFLANSGHARMTVCECVLLVAPIATGVPHFLTVVLEASLDLNLGWALHTRTLDATWGDGWPNPSFGADAVRNWSSFA